MRVTNTITLRVHTKDLSLAEKFISVCKLRYSKKIDSRLEVLKEPGFDTIYVSSVKMYTQPVQKLFLSDVKSYTVNLSDLVSDAPLHLDSSYNFNFRLLLDSFFSSEWIFVPSGDVVQVTCNLAAFPKNESTARAVLKHLFA